MRPRCTASDFRRTTKRSATFISLSSPASRSAWPLPLRSLDYDFDREGLGRRSFLGDRDGLFGGHPSGGSPERLGPRGPPRHAPELQHVRLALVRAEEEDGPVFSDEHLARAGLDLVAAERA